MFKALFNIILNMLGTLVQLVTYPINSIITSNMPDLSSKIADVVSTLSSIFDTILWGLGLLPDVLITTLIFILTIEIAKHTIVIGTHALIKVWNLIQKVKFW